MRRLKDDPLRGPWEPPTIATPRACRLPCPIRVATARRCRDIWQESNVHCFCAVALRRREKQHEKQGVGAAAMRYANRRAAHLRRQCDIRVCLFLSPTHPSRARPFRVSAVKRRLSFVFPVSWNYLRGAVAGDPRIRREPRWSSDVNRGNRRWRSRFRHMSPVFQPCCASRDSLRLKSRARTRDERSGGTQPASGRLMARLRELSNDRNSRRSMHDR